MNNYVFGTYKIRETITFRHFISCGLSLKIEPANDGYVGGPAGSPWSEFKQSLSAQGMCLCKCSWTCVYLAVQVFLRSYGTPIFDPVIPFQNHPQASPKGGGLNTQWTTHSEAPSAQTCWRLSPKEQTVYSLQIPSPFIFVCVVVCTRVCDLYCTTVANSQPPTLPAVYTMLLETSAEQWLN